MPLRLPPGWLWLRSWVKTRRDYLGRMSASTPGLCGGGALPGSCPWFWRALSSVRLWRRRESPLRGRFRRAVEQSTRVKEAPVCIKSWVVGRPPALRSGSTSRPRRKKSRRRCRSLRAVRVRCSASKSLQEIWKPMYRPRTSSARPGSRSFVFGSIVFAHGRRP